MPEKKVAMITKHFVIIIIWPVSNAPVIVEMRYRLNQKCLPEREKIFQEQVGVRLLHAAGLLL